MTVTAVLSRTVLAAPPGGEAGCDVRVANTGCEPVTVDVALAGPAAPWAAAVPARLALGPGALTRARVTVEIPRSNDLAGTRRDLTVVVACADAAGPPVELVARVAVAESRDLRASVTPLIARARGPATYTLTVANLGTGPRRVDLAVEAEARVRLSPPRLVVAAGEKATAELTVTPRRRLLAGGPRPHPVVVHVRSEDGPQITASATHFQERARWPLVAAVAVVAAVIVGLLAAVAGGGAPPVPAVVAPATSAIAASGCRERADQPAQVDIAGFAFCLAVLAVAPGSEVVWVNADLRPTRSRSTSSTRACSPRARGGPGTSTRRAPTATTAACIRA